MTNEKRKEQAQPGSEGACKEPCDVRCKAETQEETKARKGQIGFLRRKNDEVVVALVIAVKDVGEKQVVTVQWFGETVLGRVAGDKDVEVGLGRGCYFPQEKALLDRIAIERSGISALV